MNLQCYGQLHLVMGSDPLKSNETTNQMHLDLLKVYGKTETNFPKLVCYNSLSRKQESDKTPFRPI